MPNPSQSVLVIGYGFVGSHLVDELRARGKTPVVLTKDPPGAPARAALQGVHTIVGDASDRDSLHAALDGIDHVMFAATGLMPAEANADPVLDLQLSLGPLLLLLDALRERPGVGLTYFSSGGTVYGRAQTTPITEDHPTDPLGAYGINKLASEKYIGVARQHHGVPTRILRCSNVYGPGQPADRSQGVVAVFIDRLLRGEPVRIFGEGNEVRDYVYVTDVAAAAVALLDRPDAPPVLNVGSGAGTSVQGLLALLESLTGKTARVDRLPAREFDVPAIVLDITRLRAAIRYEPIALRDGLSRTIAAAATRAPR